ncbi:MAG: RNA-binding protein [Cyanobacteria bacterium]|nr:RNA-binding protein [Cyanobacteriota bacterium]
MNSKLYVGNLPFSMDETELSELFSECGEVLSAVLPTDRESGRKRGFGFVEMKNHQEAEEAIAKFNGTSLKGRVLVVSVPRQKATR